MSAPPTSSKVRPPPARTRWRRRRRLRHRRTAEATRTLDALPQWGIPGLVASTASPESEPAGRAGPDLRLAAFTVVVLLVFAALFGRLWFMQVMAGERYEVLAQGNAVREIPVTAPRGQLLDLHGAPIVTNRYALVVSVRPDEMGARRNEVFTDLSRLLRLPLPELARRVDASRAGPFRAKPVLVDAPKHVVFAIHEDRATRFPGVYAETVPVRHYPHGSTAAHLVGYVGEISEAELTTPAARTYQQGDEIGWSGLEQTQEDLLRGRKGLRRVEVDAKGRVLGDLGETLPTAGADLRLTLDLPLQRAAEQALIDGIRKARKTGDTEETGPGRGGTFKAPAGSVVVLDTATGGIAAMASYPSFEPARFVGGIDQRYWTTLQSPGNHYPLINRAVQSAYPPGSVFKVVTAAAGLEAGFLTPSTTLPCPGSWRWGSGVWANWRPEDSGSMAVAESLKQSCDTFYYELARRMFLREEGPQPPPQAGPVREQVGSMALAFGLGEPSGVELPNEEDGAIPGREWKQAFWERSRDNYCTQAGTLPAGSYGRRLYGELCEIGNVWRGADAVNMAIGQGDVQTTPLQIANLYAAIANGGTLHRPHVVDAVLPPGRRAQPVRPEVSGRLPISDPTLAAVRAGLLAVTAPDGTAGGTFGAFPVKVAGKTGTAEFKPKQPYAWFAGYGPSDKPTHAVVAMVEEGGGGSATAAPIARRVFEHLFRLPPTPVGAPIAPPGAPGAAAATAPLEE